MINKNIIKIRKDLDKLDDKFIELIKKRTILVQKILKNKKFKKDIVDKKRISYFKEYCKKSKKEKLILRLHTKYGNQ